LKVKKLRDMTENSEYDVIGELFRQRLESHRLPVGANGWNEIEQRLNKRKNNAVIWLWRGGAMAAAAASIAIMIIISRPDTEKTDVMAVSQDAVTKKPATTDYATKTIVTEHETATTPQSNVIKPTNNVAVFEQEKTENLTDIDSVDVVVEDEIFIAAAENTTEVIPIVNGTLKSDILFFEDIPTAKKEKKWLLAAAFSTNGNNSESFFDNGNTGGSHAQLPQSVSTRSSFNNEYARDLSGSIKSLSATDNKFTNIRHLPPLSFGMMVRSVGKHGGIESGLLYTYLSSSFEWSDAAANYKANHNLHYVGIPVNMLLYLWNSSPNLQIYLSGGLTVEKGIRAMYNQEMRTANRVHSTTIKKSSIDGVQLSMNGAFGANYRLYKGFGIYFEPRFGYSFDCNQPVSIRTESPLYVGVNMGLNYEFGIKK
jgi:hypothetical protein